MKAYRQDLAYIHDVGFSSFAERAAPALLDLLQGVGVTGGLVVDLGCGSGLWARCLVDAGYAVLGIDISRDMLALARKRVPEGTFRAASFVDEDFPECAAITSLGECLNYLFDERSGEASLRRLFRRAYRSLQRGGIFVFDVAEPGGTPGSVRNFSQGSDWACLVEYDEEPLRDRLTRRITTFRRTGTQYRRDEETHVQQLYKGTELATELRKIGFRVRTVRGYGELRFPKAQVGLIARKP